MNLPRVSIVIPVYNGANYLGQAIDSALAQTYANREIIVVNDGSDDQGATEIIARSYGSALHYIAKPNGGVASALNAGIAAMTGDYFSWLSHDDLYLPEKLERQVSFLKASGPDAAIAYCDYRLIDASGQTIRDIKLPTLRKEQVFHFLITTQSLHGCTVLAARRVFEEAGLFREDLPTTQDYDMWVRLSKRFDFLHVPEALVAARQHDKQGSRTMHHSRELRSFYETHAKEFTPDAMNKWFSTAELPRAYAGLCRVLLRRRYMAMYWAMFKQGMAHLGFAGKLKLCKALIPPPGRLLVLIYQALPDSIKGYLLLFRNARRREGQRS